MYPTPLPHAPAHRALSARVNTLGQDLLRRYGQQVHKLAINAGFTCPNRDGTKGHRGCTFCNNQSFSPNAEEPPGVSDQIAAGRAVLARRTGARRFLAYFQAYTNTYDLIERLRARYDEALAMPDVVGLSVGTRPDCVPEAVLDLLAGYRDQGKEGGWNWGCNRRTTAPWSGSIGATASPTSAPRPVPPIGGGSRSAPT